jgi:lactam utilization protein B
MAQTIVLFQLQLISFRDRGYCDTTNSDTGSKVYSLFTTVAVQEQVIVALNKEGVMIEQNDRIKLTDNKSFVHSDSPTELKFLRDGEVLIELERQVCSRAPVRLEY